MSRIWKSRIWKSRAEKRRGEQSSLLSIAAEFRDVREAEMA